MAKYIFLLTFVPGFLTIFLVQNVCFAQPQEKSKENERSELTLLPLGAQIPDAAKQSNAGKTEGNVEALADDVQYETPRPFRSFVWPVPQSVSNSYPVRSDIVRMPLPNGPIAKAADYEKYAQSLVKQIQRAYGSGSPALVFFTTNLTDPQVQNQLAQILFRELPDSVIVGAFTPLFYTQEGVFAGKQVAVWHLGGANIRISASVIPIDEETQDAQGVQNVQNVQDKKNAENARESSTVSRTNRFTLLNRLSERLLFTDQDRALILIHRLPASYRPASTASAWQTKANDRGQSPVPAFTLPFPSDLPGALFFAGKRYSHALIGLSISGTLNSEVQKFSMSDLRKETNNSDNFSSSDSFSDDVAIPDPLPAVPWAVLTVTDRPPFTKDFSDFLSTVHPENQILLHRDLDSLQKRFGKLTPLLCFPIQSAEPELSILLFGR